ncbi:hypothetical protein [Leifsonia sp. LS1]|uniref:hypothetical protein n=1 Tax=Leifsonia sp. LS1 TaxID=2828483 RepID=UPI001CFDF10E|nr:hypothetical protein [Leifsonia sp. LS1]
MIGAFSQIETDSGRAGPGEVPASRLTSWRLRDFEGTGSLPFVDLEATATHAYLPREAASVLRHQERENLDVADVRGPNRLLARAIASRLYPRTDVHGHPLHAGIRHMSRRGDFECCAIFDGTAVELCATHDLKRTDPALRAVLERFGMATHS